MESVSKRSNKKGHGSVGNEMQHKSGGCTAVLVTVITVQLISKEQTVRVEREGCGGKWIQV